MSGRLIILPKKSYCPWNPENVERVLRDEREHAEKIEQEAKKQKEAESRKRLNALKNGGSDEASLQHVNLFQKEEEEEKERGFDSLSGGLSFRRRVSFYIECNKALLELELETFTKNGDSFSPLILDDLDDATAHHHHRSILDLCLSGVEETSSCDTREES